jgi:hypothetical protein
VAVGVAARAAVALLPVLDLAVAAPRDEHLGDVVGASRNVSVAPSSQRLSTMQKLRLPPSTRSWPLASTT